MTTTKDYMWADWQEVVAEVSRVNARLGFKSFEVVGTYIPGMGWRYYPRKSRKIGLTLPPSDVLD